MKKQEYTSQKINAYLLGSLPESEAAHLDELSFTDDEFADLLKAAEKDLVDAYVRGELAGANLEKFKSHYLVSPLRREKVDFARAFQAFAERSAAKESENLVAGDSKPKPTVAGFFSALNIFNFPNPLLQWGLTAAVLVFVVLGGWWIARKRLGQPEIQMAKQDAPLQKNQELPKPSAKESVENSNTEKETATVNKENEAPQESEKKQTKKQVEIEPTRTIKREPTTTPPAAVTIASFLLAPSLRSGSRIPNLSIPKQTDFVAMKLQLEAEDYTTYRVALVDESGNRNLWRSGTLRTKSKADYKFLNVRFPAKLLKSQIYSLTVSGINSNGEAEIISNYPFRSVLK